jgi:hypothetical protein
MIWFGNIERFIAAPLPQGLRISSETARMQLALERVAESAPGLGGQALVDALVTTALVDRSTVERLLPTFRHFDPDRHFSDYLRRLSFRGRTAADQFRTGIRCVVEEITGSGMIDQVGPEPCVRFTAGSYEGIILAQPEVSFTIGGRTRDAVAAAVEEMPDVMLVVARNFERSTSEHLASLVERTGVRGTLVTVNLLLGIRASAIRYQPRLDRIVEVLAKGGTLRSVDIACLGDREVV